MTPQQFYEFAQVRGLICMGSTLAGVWGGWPFLAAVRSGRRDVLRASLRLDRGPSANDVREAAMPAGCRLTLKKGELRLTCSAREDDLLALFQAGMDAAVGLLCACSATLPPACALCSRKGWDAFALVKGRYVPVHQDCCEERCRRVEDRAALNAGGGNYLTGWLGALAGGFAGLLPTVLTAALWGMVSVWLCLCIPFGAYYGYKLCRGRMDRMAVAATVISSLIQVFLLDQIRYYLDFTAQGIFPFVFASVAHYMRSVPLEEMLLRMVEPLQFVTLGDVCALCIIDIVHWDRSLEANGMLDSLMRWKGTEDACIRPTREETLVWARAEASASGAGQEPPPEGADGPLLPPERWEDPVSVRPGQEDLVPTLPVQEDSDSALPEQEEADPALPLQEETPFPLQPPQEQDPAPAPPEQEDDPAFHIPNPPGPTQWGPR